MARPLETLLPTDRTQSVLVFPPPPASFQFSLCPARVGISIRVHPGKPKFLLGVFCATLDFCSRNRSSAAPQLGTILLVALPLGAVLCFFDLLGARALARGEVRTMSLFLTLIFPTPGSTPSRRAASYRWPYRAPSMARWHIHLRAINTPYSLAFGCRRPKKSRRGWYLGTSGRSIATRSPW